MTLRSVRDETTRRNDAARVTQQTGDDPWTEWRKLELRRQNRWLAKMLLAIVLGLMVLGGALAALGQERCPAANEAPPPGACHYQDGGVQDPHCTPGDFVAELTVEDLCTEKQTRRCKPDGALRRALLRAYGVRSAKEIDHLIPLCAGGTNSTKNLWPQQAGVAEKDRLEAAVCRRICKGEISPDAARAVLLNWDWRGPHGEWQSWARDGGQ